MPTQPSGKISSGSEAHRATWTQPQVESLPEESGSDGTRQTNSDTGYDFSCFREATFELPGYQITGHLGSGGMGHIFSAHDFGLDREVAIKVVRSELLDKADMLHRFTTEVRTTATLSHPCIPPIFASGRLPDGRPYLVMKRLHGEPLQCHLERRVSTTEDLPRFTQYFLQICQAVAHAHRHNQKVIHRDLKPSNVMIENFGGVQVLDWGIAKQLKRGSSAQGLTVDGKGMGSLAYMPPEQFLGEWDRVDERADVFALGAILCVILSNEAPHAWGPLREANLSKAIERLKASGHEPGLINIAVQCLSYDPADRPSDAGAVLKLLEIYRVEVVERLKTIEIDKAITAKAARLEQEQEIAALKARAKDSRRRRQKLLWLGIILFIGVGLLTTGTLVWSKLRDIATVQAFSQSSREASGVGDRRKAIDEYNKARDGYESLLSSSFLWNRHKYEFELAEVCTHLAELLEKDREGTAAEIALRQAQALLEKLRKDEAITRDQLDLALAEVHHHWGIHLAQRSDHSKAVEHYNTSVRLREGVVSTNRSSRDYRRNLALAYGYKGDSELEIEDFRQAKESYDAACRFRKLLAEEMPDDLEAHCLHARDFENFARLCDRQGKTEDALRMYRERNRHYGIRSELDRLPGAYWLERANTNLDIAEYRLLCASPTDDLTEIEMCLNAAGNEYNFLGEGGPQEDFPSDLQSALARLYVCQSRLEHLRGAAHLRNQAAENAIKLLNILDDSTKARPSDYYQLAVAHALLGAEDRNDSNRILARDRLLKAKRKGFNDTKRVKRDGILSQALAVDAQ